MENLGYCGLCNVSYPSQFGHACSKIHEAVDLACALSEEVERLKGGWMPWSSAPSDGTWFAACLRGGNGVDTVRMGSLGMWERLDMAEWRPFLPVHIAHVWMPLPGRPETA